MEESLNSPKKNNARIYVAIGVIFFLSLLLHFFLWYFSGTLFVDQRWIHYPIHSVVEGIGCFVALFVAGLLRFFYKRFKKDPFYLVIGGALIGMGILDGFHAMTHAGDAFVFLHSLATLVGGVLFAMILFPEKILKHLSVNWLYLVALLAAAAGMFFCLYPHAAPDMFLNGHFSLMAKTLNMAGGLLMIGAALKLLFLYSKHRTQDYLLFTAHCALFGAAAVLFEASQLWNLAWWGWHILRFMAYGMAVIFAISSYHHVSRQLEQERAHMTERKRFEWIVESSLELLVMVDQTGKIVMVNSRVESMLGYKQSEVLHQPVEILVPAALREAHQKHRKNYYKNPAPRQVGLRRTLTARKKDGTLLPVEITLNPIDLENEVLTLATVQDASERMWFEASKENERRMQVKTEKLEQLASEDPLTGVLNRRGFDKILTRATAEIRRMGTDFQVLLLDLDNFKQINDRFGHGMGDMVIRQVAQAICKSMRLTDEMARIGGDEFLILLKGTREAEAFVVAQKILNVIRGLKVGSTVEGEILVTASIGMIPLTYDYFSIESLMERLHLHLAKSKQTGKDRVTTDANIKSEKDSVGDLRESLLMQDSLYVLAQPIVELASGKAVGYEMLSRHTYPGFENPDDFLKFAKINNMLNAVDRFCLFNCIEKSKKMSEAMRSHINIYPSTLLDIPIEQIILACSGRKPQQYCLEISEQQIIGDPAHLREKIKALKELGFGIAIDDVGFGYSSLESLVTLEPHIVKIDRSCISGIDKRPEQRKRLKRFLDIFSVCRTEAMAEGVETKEEADILCDLGVVHGQGFYYGRPA